MMKKPLLIFLLAMLLLAACQPSSAQKPTIGSPVIAVETFLADMAQNVAGERLVVETLMPYAMDPHSFQPNPSDVARIAKSGIVIVNGGGMEPWLEATLRDVGGAHLVITASDGISGRATQSGAFDPHFWLDPLLVVRYAEKIRDQLIAFDPANEASYTTSAGIYIVRLNQLDAWILQEVMQIPPENRLLVTNHESLGYFADRYGFTVVGTIIPKVSNEGAPNDQQMAALIEKIRTSGAKAIFLETGSNTALAEQVAAETGVKVVTGLYTHTITPPGEPAPTYIEMMKANVRLIVNALK